ncbi:undecaprenyldiphospho-muramoylpentapeptide beta-N-acetylglucosaminyltransferase [Cellulosilyticum ruminicola]|uniref:undecaprenyldiphospho-muramoylpentapeptide beta-N-acetylglucosaminyltransferase n=1 Tax=Cellulosilyticum ruminicola TaxID=425254 RepID=UPI0006CFADDB|nr:undecaprenyldiphospho-muramoylpentapeptide beta-N-acetylglucosaminyltransferase [Cellulosilyticum ruminicola]
MKTIVLTGGGTAGHVTPNIALIPSLREDGWDIKYIGSYNGMEKELITRENIPYYGISSGKLRRYLSKENLKDPFKVMKGYFEACRLLKKIKPQVVFSKGGFVTVPVVLAARTLGIPVVIHESDMTPGLANKIAMRGAKTVCVNFEETLKYVGDKGVLTGSPIRKELLTGDKEKAYRLCGFKQIKPVLLMMGGSSGANTINVALREALPELLKRFNIIHICGKGNLDEAKLNVEGYKQFEYANAELADLFAATDMMLSRAGANALAEIVALNIPSLLVPLSAAASRGDQILNAKAMAQKGYCKVLFEEDLTADSLVSNIKELDMHKESYIQAMQKDTKISGIQKVMKEIQKVMKEIQKHS